MSPLFSWITGCSRCAIRDKRRERLALRPGRDDHYVLGRVIVDVSLLDQGVGRNSQVAQIPSDTHVAHHGTADVDHLALVGDSRVEDLLHAVDVGGEAGHDHPLPAGGEHPFESGADVSLRCRETRNFGIGRVDHEQVDTLLTEPGEGAQVRDPAVQRQLI